MDSIQSLIQQLARMQWSDYLDIALVAYGIYLLLPLIILIYLVCSNTKTMQFYGNPDVLPEDGTICQVTFTLLSE